MMARTACRTFQLLSSKPILLFSPSLNRSTRKFIQTSSLSSSDSNTTTIDTTTSTISSNESRSSVHDLLIHQDHPSSNSSSSFDPSISNSSQIDHHQSNSKILRFNTFIQKLQDDARRTIQFRQRLAADRVRLSQLGSIQDNLEVSKPSNLRINPQRISELTLGTLISATSHLGHNKSLTCTTNHPMIYGSRSNITIIDLRLTLSYLRRACKVVRETVENDGIVLFSNGVPGTEKAIQLASQRLARNGYSLGLKPNGKSSNWVRGTLTNSLEVLKRPRQVAKQIKLSNQNEDQTLKFESGFSGEGKESSNSGSIHQRRKQQQNESLETLKFLPSLIIIFDPRKAKVLIREANLKGIPTIGVIDTDLDPRIVTYPIPANDDSIRSIELIAGVLSRAGQDGLKRRIQSQSSKFKS